VVIRNVNDGGNPVEHVTVLRTLRVPLADIAKSGETGY
jgi:hypothetical protein